MPANPTSALSGSAPPAPTPDPDIAKVARANELLKARVLELETVLNNSPARVVDEQLRRIAALENALQDSVYAAKREAYLHAKDLAAQWKPGDPDPIDTTVDDLDKKHRPG
jgi:hypothetical protein